MGIMDMFFNTFLKIFIDGLIAPNNPKCPFRNEYDKNNDCDFEKMLTKK